MKEIVLFRAIVTILLVLYHSFCFYRGSWDVPSAYTGVDIKIYELIANITYSFMLEGFTFIAGFVYAYQVKKNGDYSFKELIPKKIKRLFQPALFWGVIYLLIFNELINKPIVETCFNLICGVYHLWFLPMLFFCFLFFWLADKFINIYVILFGSFFLMLLKSWINIPFGIGYSFQYFYFFTLGVFLYKNIDFVKKILVRKTGLILCLISYLLLFISYHYIDVERISFMTKVITYIELRMFKTFGLLMVFIAITMYLDEKTEVGYIARRIASLSMGIYIFHQMILDYLYYHTPLASYVNFYLFPIVGFVLSFLLSMLFTHLLKRVRYVRNVI
jgi:fucose 4-O-acetylase-like acetyltransferase